MEWFSLAHASQLWLFFVLVLGIIVLPGMDMAFVLGSSLVDGLKGGVAALSGVVVGGMVHTAMIPRGDSVSLTELKVLESSS